MRRRRRKKFDYFYAVGVRTVAKFLDRPHRHVVIRIDAGERVVSPTMWVVHVPVGVVVRAAIGENIRHIH